MENKEIVFVDGLLVKKPREGAPDYVKALLSFKRHELIQWLEGRSEEWINVDVLESKAGKWYGKLNDWKPEKKAESFTPPQAPQAQPDNSSDIKIEDIPF